LAGHCFERVGCRRLIHNLFARANVQLLHLSDEIVLGHASSNSSNRKANLSVVVRVFLLRYALPAALTTAEDTKAGGPTRLEYGLG
jgi:hypothetical protein